MEDFLAVTSLSVLTIYSDIIKHHTHMKFHIGIHAYKIDLNETPELCLLLLLLLLLRLLLLCPLSSPFIISVASLLCSCARNQALPLPTTATDNEDGDHAWLC